MGQRSGRAAGKPDEIGMAPAKLFRSLAVTSVPLKGAFFASELPEVSLLRL